MALLCVRSAQHGISSTLQAEEPGTAPAASAPPSSGLRARSVFFDHRSEHLLVQAEVGDQFLQPAVLVLQLLQALRLVYFQAAILCFPGIDRVLGHAPFSTSLHLAGKTQSAQGSEAVEFFFPLAALRCYEKYDCTGQQLIDAGVVLINGERVSLDLQIAEGGAR
jgi:hypothetical protein